MTRIFVCTALLAAVCAPSSGCRDQTDDPQSPPPDQTSATASADKCGQHALLMFQRHLQPAIDATCGNGDCHGDGGSPPGGGLMLLKSESDNRDRMSSHRNGWLIEQGRLLDVFRGGIHEWGDQVALGHITEEGITAWVAAEHACL